MKHYAWNKTIIPWIVKWYPPYPHILGVMEVGNEKSTISFFFFSSSSFHFSKLLSLLDLFFFEIQSVFLVGCLLFSLVEALDLFFSGSLFSPHLLLAILVDCFLPSLKPFFSSETETLSLYFGGLLFSLSNSCYTCVAEFLLLDPYTFLQWFFFLIYWLRFLIFSQNFVYAISSYWPRFVQKPKASRSLN